VVAIGVIGANGQVGSEVCLYLSRMADVRVIPICRNELSSAFIRRAGLEVRHGRIADPAEAPRLLAGCDVVADLSLPKGLASELRSAYRTNITQALRYAPAGTRYVFASTIMAFGMDGGSRSLADHTVARTVYGATKRYAERHAERQGRRFGHETYILRLGQVHGEMQAVSRGMIRALRDETALVPDGPSWTVFTFSVAEALVNIARGLEKPGRYTMVSTPEWSWQEVYEFYCREAGIQPRVSVEQEDPRDSAGQRLGALARHVVDPLLALVVRRREVVAGHLLYAFPGLEHRMMALHGCRNARREVAAARRRGKFRPFEALFRGRAPGPRLTSLSDTRTSMAATRAQVQELLNLATVLHEPRGSNHDVN
jgi:nucleoside-diphosphate-sugar epimerase